MHVSNFEELSLVRVQRPLASGGLLASGLLEDLRIPVHGLLSKLGVPTLTKSLYSRSTYLRSIQVLEFLKLSNSLQCGRVGVSIS